MNAHQREIVELLRASGSKLVRRAGKGGEVWRLPNGMSFVTRTDRAQEHGVAHELADLRRKLGDVDPAKLAAARKIAAPCDHKWERRGAALFCARCYDIRTIEQQEEQKMEPLKVMPAEPAKKEEKRLTAYKTHWSKEQDRALVEAYAAGLAPEEVAQLLQDVRPGVDKNHVIQRANVLRSNMRALKGEPAPGKGKGVKGARGRVVPIEMTLPGELPQREMTAIARAVVAPPPPPPSTARPALARVTFEIGGKVRVVEVDEATAREMYAKAMTL